jgi:hypothetical protein
MNSEHFFKAFHAKKWVENNRSEQLWVWGCTTLTEQQMLCECKTHKNCPMWISGPSLGFPEANFETKFNCVWRGFPGTTSRGLGKGKRKEEAKKRLITKQVTLGQAGLSLGEVTEMGLNVPRAALQRSQGVGPPVPSDTGCGLLREDWLGNFWAALGMGRMDFGSQRSPWIKWLGLISQGAREWGAT